LSLSALTTNSGLEAHTDILGPLGSENPENPENPARNSLCAIRWSAPEC